MMESLFVNNIIIVITIVIVIVIIIAIIAIDILPRGPTRCASKDDDGKTFRLNQHHDHHHHHGHRHLYHHRKDHH